MTRGEAVRAIFSAAIVLRYPPAVRAAWGGLAVAYWSRGVWGEA